MSLPVLKIIWAGNDSSGAHWNHLHVEGIPKQTGTPPLSNPGMTDSVWAIYVALSQQFGQPAYMSGGDWNHMGWYNRRYIAGTTIWTQHSWSNAIDIGPYYGVEEQQRFYDFLTGADDMAILTDDEQRELQKFLAELRGINSNVGFVRFLIPWFREWRALKPSDIQGAALPKEETVKIVRP
jgi:hypothetical protein